MSKMQYEEPFFMIIGAQKSGTSWTYQYLRDHPAINTLPIKEFHYFDEVESRASGSSTTSSFDRKRNALLKCLAYGVIKRELRYWSAGLHYAFTRRDLSIHSLERYAKMFRGRFPSGDITPAYATLSDETVKAIADRFPDLKIIYILRNPVDRLWSATKMHYIDHKKVPKNQLTNAMIMEHFDKENRRNDFLYTMETWESHFRKENIFYGFYDKLQKDPRSFIREIETFLDVPHLGDSVKLRQEYNKGERLDMTGQQERYLYEKFLPMISELAARFSANEDNYPLSWREKGNALLKAEK